MSDVERLMRDAMRYQKMGDHMWATRTLEKAYQCALCMEDYKSMADIKREMGIVGYKRGHHLPAIHAYTESSLFYKKVGDTVAYMDTLETLVEWCISFRDFWNALFHLEILVEHFREEDPVKCKRLAFRACQCLLAHHQVDALNDLFLFYRGLISDTTKEGGVVDHLLATSNTGMKQSEWESLVFT